MKSVLIGWILIWGSSGLADVHPIKEISIKTHTATPFLEAEILLEDGCTHIEGNSLFVDTRHEVITLVQFVKDAPQPLCHQMISSETSEFALSDLPTGVFDLVDGYDEHPLGTLWVNADGDLKLLE